MYAKLYLRILFNSSFSLSCNCLQFFQKAIHKAIFRLNYSSDSEFRKKLNCIKFRIVKTEDSFEKLSQKFYFLFNKQNKKNIFTFQDCHLVKKNLLYWKWSTSRQKLIKNYVQMYQFNKTKIQMVINELVNKSYIFIICHI